MNYQDKLEIKDSSGEYWRIAWIRKVSSVEGFETTFKVHEDILFQLALKIINIAMEKLKGD